MAEPGGDILTRLVVQAEVQAEQMTAMRNDMKDSQARMECAIKELRQEVQLAIANAKPMCPSAKCLAHDKAFSDSAALIEALEARIAALEKAATEETTKRTMKRNVVDLLIGSGFLLGVLSFALYLKEVLG